MSVDHIDVFYGQVQVLRAVTFNIEEKKIVSLLGSNGAGKTTTVNAISGIISARKGSIRFMGQDITHSKPYSRVGMGLVQVPEGRRIFPTLTSLENLEMGSYLKGPKSFRKQSLRIVMEMFPILSNRKKQTAGTLSGGEQQMLAIARGLMSRPKLLILDEPSLGLAPIIVDEMFSIIEKINGNGITVLVVEQNVSQALALSHQSFVLEEGHIALSGTGKDLLSNSHVKTLYLGL